MGCYAHATHVAGIIGATLGNGGVAGVNANVSLISVSVSTTQTLYSCADGLTSPAIASAMDWIKRDIIDNGRGKVGIVNISINGAEFSPDDNSLSSLNSKMLGLATPSQSPEAYPGAFIAQSAGNYYTNACSAAFGYPGWVSSPTDGIMVVGAIEYRGQPLTPANGGIPNGYPAFKYPNNQSGSNYGACVDVWAPGKDIYSTYSSGNYDSSDSSTWQKEGVVYSNYVNMSGTSMAAPHIAAVAAFLSETQGLNSPSAIETAVRNLFYQTQPAQYDNTNRPINLVKFIEQPGAATLISPIGIVFNNTPAYTWNPVQDSVTYELSVSNGSGQVVGVPGLAANTICNATTCSITPASQLQSGVSYSWAIRASNSAGIGPWSATSQFFVSRPRIQGNISELMPSEE